jgi:2-hydroxycyclohexanecarboxyl-CoA dehydrogenase
MELSTQKSSVQGKAVFISGGSAGIGFEVARIFAKRGASVVITGRSAKRGASALDALRALSPRSFFLVGDANDAQCTGQNMIDAEALLGQIDVVISAGAEGKVPPTLFADMTPEQIETSFKSRLLPRIHPVHAALPALRRAGGGSVVMITTDAARHVTPGESMIGAAGAAVLLLTKALARELSRDLIRVNSVAMTITSDTPSWDRAFAQDSLVKQVFSKALKRFPFGRAPNAIEVANTIAFLASDEAAQISGQTISVNGGLSYGGW